MSIWNNHILPATKLLNKMLHVWYYNFFLQTLIKVSTQLMHAMNVRREHTTSNTHMRRNTCIQDQLNYYSHFKVISSIWRQHIDFRNWMISSLLALLGAFSLLNTFIMSNSSDTDNIIIEMKYILNVWTS